MLTPCRRVLVGLLGTVVSFAGGCVTVGDPTAPPPAGVVGVDVGAPAAGTRWVMRETSHNRHTGQTQTNVTRWSVVGDGVHARQPVYHLSDGRNIHVHDRLTGSWMAELGGDSRPLYAVEPHDSTLPPTLWVGKAWVARYTSREGDAGRTFYDLTFVRKVAAYEDVQVPAGTFKAFRIETVETDERSAVRHLTYWYAPDLRLVVKRTGERYVSQRHAYLRQETAEMIEYRAAATAPPAAPGTRVGLEHAISVPVRIVNNLTLVEVVLNGAQRVPFIVDTGASHTSVSPAVIERLGLVVPADAPRRRFFVAGGQKYEAPTIRLAKLEVGAAAVEHLEVDVFDVTPGTTTIGGLLGGDVLHRFRFALDQAGGRMTLAPLTTQDPPRR